MCHVLPKYVDDYINFEVLTILPVMFVQHKISDVYMKYCLIILDWTSISTSSLITNALISSLNKNNGMFNSLFTGLKSLYRMVIHYTITLLLRTIPFGLF